MRNQSAQKNAKNLRKRMTDAERCLWGRIRRRQLYGYKFRRQYPVDQYVADFACLEASLVVEVDGGQHNDNRAADAARTAVLNRHGFRVLRFWNHEVLMETNAVVDVITAALQQPNALTLALPRERDREWKR